MSLKRLKCLDCHHYGDCKDHTEFSTESKKIAQAKEPDYDAFKAAHQKIVDCTRRVRK